MIQPKIWCHHDRCCEFDPGSHNARYCPEHRCKRKAESARTRLVTAEKQDEEVWELQENKKVHRMVSSQQKNEWLLANSDIEFFDIETTNLAASIGMILCACLKKRGGGTETFMAARDEEGLLSDKKLIVELRDAIEKTDYVSTFYGTNFDIPFLNTRLIMEGERPLNKYRHIDLYYVARNKLRLHSNRLQVVAETLFGDSAKTRILGGTWTHAAMGDLKALEYVAEHCVHDVEELEEVFEQLRGFVNLSATRWRRFGGSY